MAVKKIKKPDGTEETITIYTDETRVPKPRKIIKFTDNTLGYISLTPDLSSPLASSKRIKINNIVYAEMLSMPQVRAMSVSRDETIDSPELTFKMEVL